MKITIQPEQSFDSEGLCRNLREQACRGTRSNSASHRLKWIVANAIETLIARIQEPIWPYSGISGGPRGFEEHWREQFDMEPQVLCDKLRERARRITQSSAAVDRLEWKAANVIETLILQLPEKQRGRS